MDRVVDAVLAMTLSPIRGRLGLAPSRLIAEIALMSFREIMVSRLGTQHAPFGWTDALLVGFALATLVGLEWLFGRSIRKVIANIGKRLVPNRESITPDALAEMPLPRIEVVRFYKRDQLTTDLICCDVIAQGRVWTFHEELSGWHNLLAHLSSLPGFRTDWYGSVVNPPFAVSEFVAYRRR